MKDNALCAVGDTKVIKTQILLVQIYNIQTVYYLNHGYNFDHSI